MWLKNFTKIGFKSGREYFIISFKIPSVNADLPFFKVFPTFFKNSVVNPGGIFAQFGVALLAGMGVLVGGVDLLVVAWLLVDEVLEKGMCWRLSVGVQGVVSRGSRKESIFYELYPIFLWGFCEVRKVFFQNDHVKRPYQWVCLIFSCHACPRATTTFLCYPYTS